MTKTNISIKEIKTNEELEEFLLFSECIYKRDKIADEKTQIGHFEVDLTFNKNNRSANISAMIAKFNL